MFVVYVFLKNSKSFLLLISIFLVVSFFSVVTLVSAVARTDPFSPGETLDPGAEAVEPCGPTDDNCFVSINEVEGHFTVNDGGLRTTGMGTAVLSGSIDPAASTTVTGVGTLFTTELVVGDRITVSGETRMVVAIADNDTLTVDQAFTDGANDASVDVLYALYTARDSSDNLKFLINSAGSVALGSTIALNPASDFEINENQISIGDETAGGFRHWIATNHSSTDDENTMKFYLNYGDQYESTTPGTNSQLLLTLKAGQNGFVGIGNVDPQYRLDVELGGADEEGIAKFHDGVSSGALWLINGGFIGQNSQHQIVAKSGGTPITFYTGGTINSFTAGTERMRIDGTNGNVGINETAPLARLDIDGNLRTTGKATAVLTGSIDPDGDETVTGVGTAFLTELVPGDMITVSGETRTVESISSNTSLVVDDDFSDNGNDNSVDVLYALFVARDSGDNPDFSINATGEVGIGWFADPENLFTATRNQNNFTNLVVSNYTNSDAAAAQLIAGADDSTILVTAFSTTFDGGAALGNALGHFANRTGVFGSNGAGLDLVSVEGDLRLYAGGAAAGNERLRIEAGGDIGIAMTDPSVELDVTGDIEYTGDLTDVSDQRLKENISDITGAEALSIISSSQAKSFNMIGDSDRSYGFIAQEIQEIFPDAVSIVDPGNGYLGLSYLDFIPLATESIKQLNLNIESITLADASDDEEGFADRFFNRIRSWFADSLNGVGDLFANRVRTTELCLSDENGEETCITKKELDELLEESDIEVIIGTPEIIISSPEEEVMEEVVEEEPEGEIVPEVTAEGGTPPEAVEIPEPEPEPEVPVEEVTALGETPPEAVEIAPVE